MNPIIGIDPGLRECGVGIVAADTGLVLRGWLSRNPITSKSPGENSGPEAWRAMALVLAQEVRDALLEAGWALKPPLMVIERQYISGGTPNAFSILRIVGVVGAVILAMPSHRVVEVMPSQWKGGSTKGRASKQRVNKATWAAMSPEERAAAEDGDQRTKGHNVKDGVGIAKWAALNFQLLMETGSAKDARRLSA